ncbi:hypothetical protein PoB_004505000 [Plakobranchus ocellatus]|uniref:Uncharacterized protein n=1 Tax=Plakobranchus ocellatus TaxID=259542 RepID=A0AAV4BG83_9GAST|nr:hypothetical protein PoB_004505000 [Plakobranchus ocellatus]
MLGSVGGIVDSESTPRSAGTFLSRIPAPPRCPGLTLKYTSQIPCSNIQLKYTSQAYSSNTPPKHNAQTYTAQIHPSNTHCSNTPADMQLKYTFQILYSNIQLKYTSPTYSSNTPLKHAAQIQFSNLSLEYTSQTHFSNISLKYTSPGHHLYTKLTLLKESLCLTHTSLKCLVRKVRRIIKSPLTHIAHITQDTARSPCTSIQMTALQCNA